MKTFFNISAIFACIFFAAGCKQHEIEEYNAGHYVQFTNSAIDTILLSYFLYPTQESFDVPLPVKLIGMPSNEDLPITLQPDSQSSSLDGLYDIPDHLVFGKGKVLDTLYLHVNRLEALKGKEVNVILDIKSNEFVQAGQTDSSRVVLKIGDKITKPKWWDGTMDANYLGVYSDKKYQTFISVVGVGDLSIYTTEQQRDLMLEFKHYLIQMRDAGTPVLEDDGTDMLSTVPLIG